MAMKDLSRRDFLKTAGVVGTGSFLAASGALAQTVTEPSEKKPERSQIPTRPFGKSGMNVSCLALGGMFDISSNHLLLKQALQWGVTYWDTADCYEGGNSEVGLGEFFKKYPETRKRVFLVTKSDARDPEGMTKLLDRSLSRLNTEFIDLYFIHGLRAIKEISNETRTWVEKAKGNGKIKLFGFSCHSNMEECMLAAAKLGWIDGLMIAYNFRIMHSDKMKAAVKACAEAGIGLTAMKTQGGGSVNMSSDTELKMAGSFLEQGFTDKQAKLKAVWEDPDIASVCSQMPNMTVLMSNVAAALNRTKLRAGDIELLKRYARETSSSYCAGCANICEATLADEVPISDVMRYLMYSRSCGETDMAKALFAELKPEIHDRLNRLDFSPAEQRCPQRLEIGKLVREAIELLA